jgi:hypothetical protein
MTSRSLSPPQGGPYRTLTLQMISQPKLHVVLEHGHRNAADAARLYLVCTTRTGIDKSTGITLPQPLMKWLRPPLLV